MQYATATHVGKRKNNQDYAQASYNEKGYLAAFLCDGLGGHQGGDVASAMAVSQLGHHWQNVSFDSCADPHLKEWIQTVINQENDRILEAADQYNDLKGMGTTIVAAFFLKDCVLIINVGDSRAYIYKDDQMHQVTTDHSLIEELEQTGEITHDEAKNLVNQHMLTRSLGANEEIKVDFYPLEYHAFHYVLLCSDGLSNFVTTNEMKQILCLEDHSNDEKVQKLIQRALHNDGSDNITVSLIEQGGGDR
ncbi:Stp1/IreP family PP2C-type Ser/Thr phosphatase [Allofustis seminis]|uniref:Stp1/IreP family PP2C-type Ser/Thr phosphatase n=1 Tax=Allofustis seminis TaxID=166939 RepID=UPI00037D1184|nr:Stp1/IreP family PP2C-type Ser/Thr phosphatase [Allofustis seminis]